MYHYFLLFLAWVGIFAWAFTEERKNRLAILCIAAAGGQFVYLMFDLSAGTRFRSSPSPLSLVRWR